MTSVSARRLALGLAVLATLRVWAFTLAFPFFTNVDEHRHLDAVLKYARGQLPPSTPVRYEPETARLLGVAGSPEYLRDPVSPVRPELPPPAWQSSRAEVEARVARMEAFLRPLYSLEASQPPVYYATAGAWLALGRAVGLRDAALLYWVRALGGLAAGLLVLACVAALRAVYPERPFVVFGTALLVAAMPQDALYYVTGDAFSPLLGGLAFLGCAWLLTRRDARAPVYAATGLALAAAVLCKYPNAALYAGAALACGLALAAGAPPRRWALLWGVALLLPALWLGRNAWLGLGVSGSAFKVERLGWSARPLSEWLDHPLFSLEGAGIYLRDLVTSFWRGELVWNLRTLASPFADAVYRAASLLGLGLAAFAAWRSRGSAAARRVEATGGVAVLTAVAGLALLSLAFSFDGTVHPSPSYPYFANGRLIGGVLVPFALLLVRGIEEGAGLLPPRARERAAWGVLAGLIGVCLVSEAWQSAPVFASAYNGYHLP